MVAASHQAFSAACRLYNRLMKDHVTAEHNRLGAAEILREAISHSLVLKEILETAQSVNGPFTSASVASLMHVDLDIVSTYLGKLVLNEPVLLSRYSRPRREGGREWVYEFNDLGRAVMTCEEEQALTT